MCSEFSRWKDAEYPDIGPVEGPIPKEVDCVIVGAGIAGTEPQDRPWAFSLLRNLSFEDPRSKIPVPGIYQAKVMNEQGKSLVVFDRYHMIGGVWEFYGNEYSRVNTSERLGQKLRGKRSESFLQNTVAAKNRISCAGQEGYLDATERGPHTTARHHAGHL